LNRNVFAIDTILNTFKKDISSIFKEIFTCFVHYERTLLETIILNQLAGGISNKGNEMIFNVFLTICLFTLALSSESGMSGFKFFIVFKEGSSFLRSFPDACLLKSA
jgi:hypothetical protein